MNHYAILATLSIRVIGSILILVGLIGVVYWVFASVALETQSPDLAQQSARILSSIVFILSGAFVYTLGKPIGIFITKDLDDK